MADTTENKPVIITAERARAEARKQADKAKMIVARINASKAKRQAKRPKPRIQGQE